MNELQLVPGTRVVVLPPVESSLLPRKWGMFLVQDEEEGEDVEKLPHGTVLAARDANGTLEEYTYLVRMDGGEEELVGAGRLKALERWVLVLSQEKFSVVVKEIAENETVAAEEVGGTVAVIGGEEFAVLDGYSFSKQTYEFLDYWKFPPFRPKLRRNLTASALREYKPLHLLFDYGCVSASKLQHSVHGVFVEEDTCSDQLLVCTAQTIADGFAQVQDEAVDEFRHALAIYLVGMFVLGPFAVVVFNLVPLTYVGANLLRHVETELTTVRL